MSKRITTLSAVALAMILGLTGCSTTASLPSSSDDKPAANSESSKESTTETTTEEEPEEEPAATIQDLVVVDKGYGRDGDTYWYGIEIQNPNDDYIWTFAEVTVEAVDKDGVILDSDSNYETILSGNWNFVGTFFDVGSDKIDHLEIRGPVAEDAVYQPKSETGSFTVSDVKVTPDDWSTTVTGKVSSSFSEDQELVKLSILLRKDGKIIGSDMEFVDRVPSGGAAKFEASIFQDNLPAGVKAFVTATP